MTKKEIAKRFCKFELCTHRNGEGMCCLYNQDNCILHRLEKENAELKVTLTTGSMFNKSLSADNKYLTEERDKYRDMLFDTKDQLTKAKEIIKKLVDGIRVISDPKVGLTDVNSFVAEAEQFLNGKKQDKWVNPITTTNDPFVR